MGMPAIYGPYLGQLLILFKQDQVYSMNINIIIFENGEFTSAEASGYLMWLFYFVF